MQAQDKRVGQVLRGQAVVGSSDAGLYVPDGHYAIVESGLAYVFFISTNCYFFPLLSLVLDMLCMNCGVEIFFSLEYSLMKYFKKSLCRSLAISVIVLYIL